MTVTKRQFVSNAVWKICEQFSSKGVSMLVSVVLARILLPDDYGLLALTAIFTNFSEILIDGGFGTALIRRETIDEKDCGSVFVLNLAIAFLLYIIVFFFAPYVSFSYGKPELTPVLRVTTLSFFLQAFSSVRTALITRKMMFRQLFYCNTFASILSGVAGITAAYAGAGVWALVIQRLIQQGTSVLFLSFLMRGGVKPGFDMQRVREMWAFGMGVLGSSLLNYIGGNIYNAVVGKKYSVAELGYSDKGSQLPMQMSLYTFGAMSGTLLPALSSCQNSREQMRHLVRRVIGMTGFFIMPMMAGMIFVSRELILLLFTDKWLPAVPLMQAACIYYLATPYMLVDVQVFFSTGRSDLRVKTELLRIFMMISSIIFWGYGLHCSIAVLAWMNSIIAVIMAVLTHIQTDKLISYPPGDFVRDIWKPVVGTLIMSAVLLAADWILTIDELIIVLGIKGIAGAAVYLICLRLLRAKEIDDLLELCKSGKNRDWS